jgi:protein-tyrosine phosphatase
MIDLHCHILPGIDDGPPDVEASLALAAAAAQSGTHTIVATPHVREDYPFSPESIPDRVAALNAELERAGIDVEVLPGAELAISRAPELGDAALRSLRLGSGDHVLVETPYVEVGELLENELFDLQLRGVAPILAHPERSPSFLGDIDRLAALVDKGVLCSVTAASLAGRFGRTVRRFSVELMRAGLVHDVASDAHDLRKRTPDLREGLASVEDDVPGALAQAHWYTEDAPRAILAGEPLPARPEPPRPRGLKRLLGR